MMAGNCSLQSTDGLEWRLKALSSWNWRSASQNPGCSWAGRGSGLFLPGGGNRSALQPLLPVLLWWQHIWWLTNTHPLITVCSHNSCWIPSGFKVVERAGSALTKTLNTAVSLSIFKTSQIKILLAPSRTVLRGSKRALGCWGFWWSLDAPGCAQGPLSAVPPQPRGLRGLGALLMFL